jgi:signal transduction histidine kinase
VLEAINKQNGVFDDHDVEVLEAICSSAAIAIENARLFSTELERAQALAQALERQRELDRLQHEFIQNVSHELRTPLALIRGHAEVLENGWLGELPDEQKHSIGVIVRRSQMLTKLVDDIVGILAVENRQLQRESVDLAHMIRQGLADFQSAVSKVGLSLEAEIAPDVPPVMGDALALRRILDNLVGNALKFTPAGGRVTVRLSRLEEAIKLEVADTGIGIQGDQLGRIFDRFYQVDGSTTRQYGGVGLGLALVKEIVAVHGGQIAVTSQVGSGTTFTILFPLSVRTG